MTFLSGQSTIAQTSLTVTFNDEKAQLNAPYYLESIDDSITITKLKFYISTDTGDDRQYILFDLDIDNPIIIDSSSESSTDSLFLSLGVDSLLNTKGVQSGDLDPMHGMYWTWNSGYINFKLEGYSNSIPSRKNKFQLHLGGFLAPYNAFRSIAIERIDLKKPTNLKLAIDYLLNNIDLTETHTVMSPSNESMILADLLAKSFKLKE